MRPRHLRDFAGAWSLSRDIHDRRAGQTAQGEGQAVLTPDAEGLVYDETIRLHLPGQAPLEGRQRYLWRSVADGIAVLFGDGRAFHAIALGDAGPEAAHWCDPDQYDVVYDFDNWPSWSSLWRVSGPRKDYVMRTLYRPLQGTASGPDAA